MQEDHQQEPYYLRAKLLEAVDGEYNVRDVPLILEVLGKLESLPVTKEVLESTRLGKTVNELRRKVKDAVLARRLKDLVKKWRDAVLVNDPPQQNHHPSVNGASGDGPGPGGGGGPGGNRSIPPNYTSGYTSASSSPTLLTISSRVSPAGSHNSNSLSPRLGAMTNNTSHNNNNNTSAHHHLSIPGNRNGSSSIANRSPSGHHRNLQLSSSFTNSTLVSPSASSAASPHITSRNLVSPYKSKSPGGPILQAFTNSNLSPLPSSHLQSATSSSYAPNAESVSRTNAANKRFREADDAISASTEPPHKRSRIAVNGTLDDPMLALDDISRDSYASRGSDHSDGYTSKDPRLSSSTLSPATPGQTSTLSPQMPIPGTDSNAPSPLTLNEVDTKTSTQVEQPQPKKKRRRKQNEFYQDSEAILREKIAQAEAEKAAKAAREREAREKEAAAALANADLQESLKRRLAESANFPTENFANNEFVEKYLKSQNELRAKMERDAVDVLAGGDLHGAEDSVSNGRFEESGDAYSSQRKHKRIDGLTEEAAAGDISTNNPFPSESEILAKLPPIDPEILKEFENFEYDVNPSPLPTSSEGALMGDSTEQETDGLTQSLSAAQEKQPPKFIDWGDSDDDLEDQVKGTAEVKSQVQTETPQITAESSATTTVTADEEPDSHSQSEESKKAGLSSPFRREEEVEEGEVEKYIKDNIPNLNGNYNKDGEFKEWHELLTVESYKYEPLHILPYSIIDF